MNNSELVQENGESMDEVSSDQEIGSNRAPMTKISTERWGIRSTDTGDRANEVFKEAAEKELAEYKLSTLRTMKSYDPTRKVHLYESYLIRLLSITATDWTTIAWKAQPCL